MSFTVDVSLLVTSRKEREDMVRFWMNNDDLEIIDNNAMVKIRMHVIERDAITCSRVKICVLNMMTWKWGGGG